MILDDGFQHVQVARDLDIVLLDATDPFGGGRVLPAGRLREPLTVLREADLIVLTRANLASDALRRDIWRRVMEITGRRPVIEAVHRPSFLKTAEGAPAEAVETLQGRRAALFCGIGNPRGFIGTAEGMGVAIVSAHILRDHCAYSDATLARLAAACSADDADCVLTTEKDTVKIGARWPGPLPLRAVAVEMAFRAGRAEVEERLRQALEDRRE